MTDVQVTLIGAALCAAVIGAAAWFVGVNGVQSAFLASAVMTVGAGRAAFPFHDVRWPRRPATRSRGTRGEVAGLAWRLLDRNAGVVQPAVPRLLRLAEHRLARHGVDLHDRGDAVAAERLLGSRPYRVLQLVMGDPAHPVRPKAFALCVAAVERLGDLAPGTPVAGSPSIQEHHR